MKEDSYRDFNSINNPESKPIEKQHNKYLIKVNKNSNSSLDIIIKENDFYYESNFTEDDIQQVFDDPNKNVNDVYELIKGGNFEIEKDGNNLKLILAQERELNIKISLSSLLFNELNNKRKTKDILIIIIIIMMILIIILNIVLFSLFIKNNNKINKIESNKVLNDEITDLNEKINEIENNKITNLNNKLDMLENNNIT